MYRCLFGFGKRTWESGKYKVEKDDRSVCIKTINYNDWYSFVRDYKKDLYNDDIFRYGEYVFRGQRDEKWKLLSSFDRIYGKYDWQERADIEKQLIDRFIENVKRIIPNANVDCFSDVKKKNLAQHYGIPTRLLDWSYSPFVALYFAYEESSSENGSVAIWCLKKDHEIWNSNLGFELEENILSENERQKRQLGCFSILNTPAKSIDEFVEFCEKQGINVDNALTKMVLPCAERKRVLTELLSMNISASTIFGGYEGCARAAKTELELLLIK